MSRQRELFELLVGPEHHELLMESPHFHASVNQLAAMLPHMVSGLAEGAREQAEREQVMRHYLDTMPAFTPYRPSALPEREIFPFNQD